MVCEWRPWVKTAPRRVWRELVKLVPLGFYGHMRLISVSTFPEGKEPTWQDAETLNVGIGVLPWFKVRMQDEWLDPDEAPVIHMTLLFNYSKGKYETHFFGIESSFDITGTELREIRVAECLQIAARAGIYVKLDRDDPPASIRDWWGDETESLFGDQAAELIRKQGPTKSTLALVALVYSVAHVLSQPPAKAVETAFGLPARTAARWIARARADGVLKRPSVPGWEESVEGNDKLEEMLAAGVPLVTKLEARGIVALGASSEAGDEDGEHPKAP